MRIGIICEGEETDAKALKLLLPHLFGHRGARFLIQGYDKGEIFDKPDVLINKMLKKGAERIMIIWDLLPVGKEMDVPSQWSEKPSRKEQRQMYLHNLYTSDLASEDLQHFAYDLAHEYGFVIGVKHNSRLFNDGSIKLVCVCFTLEGWLLSDKKVLHDLAARRKMKDKKKQPFKKVKVPKPDREQKPAVWLSDFFSSGNNLWLKYYNKHEHNEVILREYIATGKIDSLRVAPSFRRVVDTIESWISA